MTLTRVCGDDAGEIEREHRAVTSDDRTQRREPVVATAISARKPTTTVGHASS
jgi:hypothetical protein